MKDGWDIKKLGEVCFITMGQSPNSESYNKLGDGLPFFQGCSDFGAIHPLVTTWCNQPNKIANPNDILMSVRAPIGTLNIADSKCCIGRGLAAFTQKEGVTINKFLYYFLLSSKGDLQSKGTGATFKAIGKELIKNYAIKLPSLSEQQHIVEELDLLSSIIEKKKAQLNELDNLAQSLFYEMFGHLYDTVFPIKPLIDICEFIKDGTHQTPTYTDDKVNGVKFLSAKDVVSGFINWENIKLIPFELHQELHKRIAPQRNDLLLCKNGTTGICAIVETDEIFDIYVSLALLRPRKPFCPKYLLYAINNPQTKRQFDESLKGIGVPNLHLGEIKKTKIVFPPLELQQQFAEKVEAIEHQRELIKQSVKEVETLFNSRMDYYFN